MIEYRNINVGELNRSLFSSFIRRQEVIKCVRRENGAWVVRDDPFIDDWSEEDYQFLIKCLKHTVSSGGFLQGAFADGQLKGFVSVEPELFGGENKYLDLSSLHVSADFRGKGIGTELFDAAKEFAKQSGQKSCIFPRIPQSKHRPFTEKWAASMRQSRMRNMSQKSRLTASLNAA